MVERDKNNPSIVMWSLGNEVEEANGSPRSIETAKRLKASYQRQLILNVMSPWVKINLVVQRQVIF